MNEVPYSNLYEHDIWIAVEPLHRKLLDRVTIDGVQHGRSRVAFILGRFVVKLPRNDLGIRCNQREYRLGGMKFNCGTHYARTRIRHINDVPIILMEKVIAPVTLDSLPSWTTDIDCGQVGYDRFGHLVAYDFG